MPSVPINPKHIARLRELHALAKIAEQRVADAIALIRDGYDAIPAGVDVDANLDRAVMTWGEASTAGPQLVKPTHDGNGVAIPAPLPPAALAPAGMPEGRAALL